jgi:GNAT superfamily N-acetyltransferase
VSRFVVSTGAPEQIVDLLPLFDGAVEWLVERGQAGQWGTEAFSARSSMVDHLHELAGRGALLLARTADGAIVGGCVVGETPPYAPAGIGPERYLEALVTERSLAGQGIGGLLVARAVSVARAAGADVLRSDCWAEAGGLVRWYERQGFVAAEVVLVGTWPARMLAFEL